MFVVKLHTLDEMATIDSFDALKLHHSSSSSEEEKEKGEESEDGTTSVVKFWWGNPKAETVKGFMHLYRDISQPPPSAGRSAHLSVLAVPNYMTGADFCQFTGSFLQNIKEMRFVRNDGQNDRYSVLMNFDTQDSADQFFKYYNSKLFSSLETEVCHVLYIADVQYTKSGDEAAVAPTGLTELPTCPVCPERLDQHISGILTTVCNHSFHSSCISKWTDSSCPVCRYCQQQGEKSLCSVCSTSDNLWICVICGFVGCGREGSDNCGSCECSHVSGIEEAMVASKIDAIGDEYNRLLTSQLENQRKYFEGLLIEAGKQRDPMISEAVEKAVSLKQQKLQAKLEKVESEKKFLEEVNESMKDNQEGWKKRADDAEERAKAALKERDIRIADLEEQVRDLMVYIEAQKLLESSGSGEIRDGTVLPIPASASSSPKSGSRSSKITGRRRR